MCDQCQQQDGGLSLSAVMAKIAEIESGVSQIAKRQHQQFPLIVEEYLDVPAGTLLTLQPQSQNRVKIQTIVAYSSASAAVVVLGARRIPVAQGLTSIGHLSCLLDQNDVRTLTATSSGELMLWLHGIDLMNYQEVRT